MNYHPAFLESLVITTIVPSLTYVSIGGAHSQYQG